MTAAIVTRRQKAKPVVPKACPPHDWMLGEIEIGPVLGESPVGPRWCAKCGHLGRESAAWKAYMRRARLLCMAAVARPHEETIPDEDAVGDSVRHVRADGRLVCVTVLNGRPPQACACGEVVWSA